MILEHHPAQVCTRHCNETTPAYMPYITVVEVVLKTTLWPSSYSDASFKCLSRRIRLPVQTTLYHQVRICRSCLARSHFSGDIFFIDSET